MSVPNAISIAGNNLTPTYSGDPATVRRSVVTNDGIVLQVDIIQSLPKKGRWRHVVRFQQTMAADVITGIRQSYSATVTIDTPDNALPMAVGDLFRNFLTGMEDLWDEIAAGQQ
jgi:hypothetical protein